MLVVLKLNSKRQPEARYGIIALKPGISRSKPIQSRKRPHDLRLSNSFIEIRLKSGFLEDSEQVKQSAWFQRFWKGKS